MITHETENHIILCPNFKVFSHNIASEIQVQLLKPHSKPIAIDMGNIYSISAEFLDMINSSEEKLILLNTSAEIQAILNLTNSDKNVKLFTTLIDLEEDKRELRNRKFSLV